MTAPAPTYPDDEPREIERRNALTKKQRSERADALFQAVRTHGPVNTGRLEAIFGQRRATLYKVLVRLEKRGLVARSGEGAYTKWIAP